MIQRRLIPTYIFLTIVSFLSVFPFYWMISAATNTSYDVSQGRLLPGSYLATNFANLTAGRDLWGTMGNSFIYAFVQTILALLVCSLAGFGFELYHDKKKDVVFTILLLAMMIPGVATMIPLFKMAAAAVVTFMNAWNSYLWPKVIMTETNAQTMPMLIANLASGYTTDYGVLMLGVLFCSIPTMIIFFILQKQFAEGLTGAVK